MFSKKLIKLSLSLKKVKSSLARGFTLIELLMVIAILAVLATVVVMVINPIELVKQSRDANRITELNQIDKALLIFQSFSGTGMGDSTKIYVSIPSDEADCSDLGLPAPGGGYTYACSNFANYRKMNGTGWIPVDFTPVQSQAGALFFALPIDPINTVANGYYYTYIPGSWALSVTMESAKYIAANAANDGGRSSVRFETGNHMALNQYLGTDTAGSAKAITAFSFTSPSATGVITGTNIAVSVPYGTTVTALVASFTTTGASVKVGSNTQTSGAIANNFTNSVTYIVTAADASTQNYVVTVTVAAQEAATAPTNIVLAVGSTAPVGGVTNVAIPAAGATDTTGAVTGWVTSTADKIKFTVTDGGSAVSTITIGGGAYTSGADYAIPSTSNLSIVVTTTEAGKTTGVRTFTVTVAAPVWACGDAISDIDTNSYLTIQISTQCWMKSNMMTTKYPDGTAITRGPTGATWAGTDLGYYAYPPNTSNNAEETLANIITNKLGFVYQWSAAMKGSIVAGAQGICPTGWHIPTDAEWKILVESQATVGCESSVGWQCSPAGSHLSDYTLNHDNSSGFSGILAGQRSTGGVFYNRDAIAYIWASTEWTSTVAFARFLYSPNDTVYRNSNNNKATGYSARCLKN